jgi:hypothetical protein
MFFIRNLLLSLGRLSGHEYQWYANSHIGLMAIRFSGNGETRFTIIEHQEEYLIEKRRKTPVFKRGI